MFSDCEYLKSVTIPDSVTCIDNFAFACCSSLESIILPSSITNIRKGAFVKTGLQTITIPSSVRSIGHRAFGYCIGLKKVVIAPNSNLEECTYGVFDGCLWSLKVCTHEIGGRKNELNNILCRSIYCIENHEFVQDDKDNYACISDKNNCGEF